MTEATLRATNADARLDEFRSRFLAIEARSASDRRPSRGAAQSARRVLRRRPCAARGRTGARQDADRPLGRDRARPLVQAHPVHAGPHAGGHHRRADPRRGTGDTRVSLPPGPIFANIVLADEINAHRRRRNRRCSKRWRNDKSPRSARTHALVERSSCSPRRPDRARGYVSAAGGPARPISLQVDSSSRRAVRS